MSDTTEPIDLGEIVAAYRVVSQLRERETTAKGKRKLESVIKRIRAEWLRQNGGDADELHETAFGGG